MLITIYLLNDLNTKVDLEALYGRPGKGLLAMTQQSLFNWDAFSNDHGHYASGGATPKLEPETIKLEPLEADDEEEATVEGLAATSGRAAETGGGGRRRNVSESSFSSGYHSSEDTRLRKYVLLRGTISGKRANCKTNGRTKLSA